MGLFNQSDDERRLREDERKRMREEAIRADERQNQNLIRTLKAVAIFAAIAVVAAAGFWLYLGAPTTGQAWADGLEKAGMPLPKFLTR